MEILPRRVGILFLIPALIFVGLFLIFPFIWVILISFTNRALTGPSAQFPSFVGLSNYSRMFNFQRWMRPGEFGNALKNTVVFVLGSAILGQVPLGLGIAVLLHRFRWKVIREIVFTLAIAAWILPGVPVAFAWIAFLDRDFGTLNTILSFLRIGRVDWYFEQPLLAIIIFNIWRGTAFSMLLFSAALGSIPPSYWDIAEVVGASPWQRFRDVIFPLIKPHILTDLILVTLWTFNAFTPYLITGGGPLFKSETIPMYTYREAFKFLEFGRGASAAVITMTINLILAIAYLAALKKQEVYK